MKSNDDSVAGNSHRKNERRKSHHTAQENRYDSLQSLGRLVEHDFQNAVLDSRRTSLPLLHSSAILSNSSAEFSTGLWRRNSSVVDYMQELADKRRRMIQRLLPEEGDCLRMPGTVEEDAECCDIKHTTAAAVDDKQGHDINDKQYSQNFSLLSTGGSNDDKEPILSTALSNDDDLKSSYPDRHAYGTYDEMHGKNDIEDAFRNLRERLARFEDLKNAQRSIHADDFQQFLGARYLELYQSRKVCRNEIYNFSHDGLSRDSVPFRNTPSPAQKQELPRLRSTNQSDDRSLSVKLMSLARKQTSDQGKNTDVLHRSMTVMLPPINSMGDKERDSKKQVSNDFRAKYFNGVIPIQNDIVRESLEKGSRKGVPHHAAKRAQIRHQNSYHINSILKELRRLSSTVDKSEQEEFVQKLEDNC